MGNKAGTNVGKEPHRGGDEHHGREGTPWCFDHGEQRHMGNTMVNNVVKNVAGNTVLTMVNNVGNTMVNNVRW